MLTTIGEYLKQARRGRKTKLTLEEVSRMTGIGVSTLSCYENGLREPSASSLFVLLRLYDADPRDLMRRLRIAPLAENGEPIPVRGENIPPVRSRAEPDDDYEEGAE